MTEAVTIIKASRSNPAFFIRNVLGTQYLTPQQMELCGSLIANKRTAAPSGHGIGKTWLAARLALWFLFSYPHSKVLTTAPTWHQVENLLWREIRKAYQGSLFPLGGNLMQTELDLDEDWFAVGLSTNDAVRFQGIHASRVMIIFDEATGIAGDIWEAAEGVAVGNKDRFLAIGNPTDPTSKFKEVCDSPLWNVIHLNAEQHRPWTIRVSAAALQPNYFAQPSY
jgi:phage terminase large subunit